MYFIWYLWHTVSSSVAHIYLDSLQDSQRYSHSESKTRNSLSFRVLSQFNLWASPAQATESVNYSFQTQMKQKRIAWWKGEELVSKLKNKVGSNVYVWCWQKDFGRLPTSEKKITVCVQGFLHAVTSFNLYTEYFSNGVYLFLFVFFSEPCTNNDFDQLSFVFFAV